MTILLDSHRDKRSKYSEESPAFNNLCKDNTTSSSVIIVGETQHLHSGNTPYQEQVIQKMKELYERVIVLREGQPVYYCRSDEDPNIINSGWEDMRLREKHLQLVQKWFRLEFDISTSLEEELQKKQTLSDLRDEKLGEIIEKFQAVYPNTPIIVTAGSAHTDKWKREYKAGRLLTQESKPHFLTIETTPDLGTQLSYIDRLLTNSSGKERMTSLGISERIQDLILDPNADHFQGPYFPRSK